MFTVVEEPNICHICRRTLEDNEDVVCNDCVVLAPCFDGGCDVIEPCCCIFSYNKNIDCKHCDQCATHDCIVEDDNVEF